VDYIRFRPLAWSRPITPVDQRRGRQTFTATWNETQSMLRLELDRLHASNIVLAADFTEADLKADGLPRANARQPRFPGVEIFFDSVHGPLVYGTDTHAFWQHNVRAIALSLQALRAVDRYGVTRSSEQYRGWRSITAGTASPTGDLSRHEAALFIAQNCQGGADVERVAAMIEADRSLASTHYRAAAKRLHPDKGGTPAAFARLQRAKAVLAV
jgi:hypothetical protein